MKGNDLLNKMDLIDPAYIEAAAITPQIKKFGWLKKFGMIAACFVLLLSIGLGTYAYAAEVKEYNDAVQFFNTYELSAEGLTRAEIKSVYRDIITESFSYTKTAEVIINSLSPEQIEGYEIIQENPTPEDVKNLWNYKDYNGHFVTPEKTNIHYENYNEYGYREDGSIDFSHFKKSYFEKYDGDTLIWSISFSEFSVSGYSIVSNGLIVYGDTPTFSSEPKDYAWFAKLNNDGELIWEIMLDNGFQYEHIAAVLENEDGSYAVISRGEFYYMCLSQYTQQGELILFKKMDITNNGIQNVARLGDGYIIQLRNPLENSKMIKVDYEGNITEYFSYTSKNTTYHITDMIEFDGKLYLSGYTALKPEVDDPNVKEAELHDLIHYLVKLYPHSSISSEELTPMVRENYTAILLICDPNVGIPQDFYSVQGSIGGKFSISDSGKLLWNVESITTTFFAPHANSFTIGGTCYVFQYEFDSSGVLIRQEKTEEITNFRR